MSAISHVGKILSLVITVLILFFSYITAVNSSSMLSKQLLLAQQMQEDLKNKYNESVSEASNYTSQSNIINSQKGKMVPINRDSADFTNLETLQDSYSKQQSKDGNDTSGSSKSVLIK